MHIPGFETTPGDAPPVGHVGHGGAVGQVTSGHVGVGHSVGGVWEGGVGQVSGAGQVGHSSRVGQVGVGGQVGGGGQVGHGSGVGQVGRGGQVGGAGQVVTGQLQVGHTVGGEQPTYDNEKYILYNYRKIFSFFRLRMHM